MSDTKQTAVTSTSSNPRKGETGVHAKHGALAASLLKHIEDIHLSVEDNVLVVKAKTITYGPRPDSVSHGIVISLPPFYPPHTLHTVLFEDGGIDVLDRIQKSVKKAKAGKNLAKHAERIHELGPLLASLLQQRALNILLGPTMGHC